MPKYRVTVFGRPRGKWLGSHTEAKQGAIDRHLALYDEANGQWYVADPVKIEEQVAAVTKHE